MPSSTGVYILLIILLVVVAVIVYYKFLRPSAGGGAPPPVILAAASSAGQSNEPVAELVRESKLNLISRDLVCTDDLQCPWGQVCSNGVCQGKPCNSDANCAAGQTCSNKVCKPKACENYRDCGRGEACVHVNLFDEYDRIGFCMPTGNSCASNADCRGGAPYCVGGKCQACLANSDCLAGEVCSDGMCKGYCKHDTDCGANGDLHCVSETHHCCPQNNSTFGGRCEVHSDCGANAWCDPKKKVCTCVPIAGKSLGDSCQNNRDCESKNCMTDKRGNKSCGWPGGQCLSDTNCPSDKPYCVTGQCRTSPVGSTCNSTAKCRQTGQNLFCVDSICSANAGDLGTHCVDNDSCRSPLICAQNSSGINVCMEQKASNKLNNINTNAGYIPPPGMPRRINRAH